MKRGKHMKKTILILLFGLLTVVGLPMVTEAAEPVDATDATIFGAQAMVPNSTEDQTEKLQTLLSQTAKEGRALFLPQGSYALSKDIAISSNYQLIGDTTGATILHNATGTPIQLTDTTYGTKTNVRLQNIAFDGINVTLKLTNQLTLANNIFYNPLKGFVVNLNADIGVKISGNIFMRDTAHMQPGIDFNRAIYIGGYSTPSRFQYMSDVDIVDNLFGLKVTELDAIKSTSRSDLAATITRLQTAIEAGAISVPNEQNYLSTGVNSFNMLKDVTVQHNFFYSPYDNENLNGLGGDHAIYFRGAQNITVVGNHLRGLQNGPAGGFKFKSGRNITIMNNYLRNTGLIMYGTPEIGLAETQAEGAISELSNWLVANNIFDWKYWNNQYAIGMEYNRHTGNNNVFNGVFINNQFVNYHNIPQNRRRELLIASGGGFRPETSFVKDNTRDDGLKNGQLLVENWTEADYRLMPATWESLISPTLYEQYKNTPIPVRNTLATPVATTIVQGQSIDPQQLVANTNDADEAVPAAKIVNPEVLNEIGQQKVTVQLTYETGSLVTVNVPVTVEAPAKKLDLSQLQTVYASIGEANQYTVYSWQLFTAIGPKTIVPSYYQQATQLLAEGQVSGDKTQEQVDQLTSNLQSAMKVLVKKADITLERAEAENELASVHKLDESVYTTDSWQAMQEALIDTTTGEGSSKQLQQLLAWSDEELLEPTLGGFKTPADAQKRINQLTQTIKTALLLLVEKSTETTSNTSESSTSSTTNESSSTSESSTSSTTNESSSTSESSTPSTTSESSSTSESSTSSTTSETSNTSESSTSSTTSESSSTSESSTSSTTSESSNTSESSTSSTTSESSNTSESSTSSTTSESSNTSESSTSSTPSETSNTNESNTPSTTSKTSSTSESSALSTTSATNSTSESSTPSPVNENSQSKGQNSVIYAVESNQDPNDAQSNSKPSAKASQTKESVAENQATKQIQTNKESSGTVKKADNTTKIAKKKFPKTGEQSSAVGSFLGLSFLSLAIATYCFKVKR
ncbi:TPA: LPXTG cell wall anchor domain-containing protein [Enterococcus faecalis OG1RF]|jgi:RhoGEF, Guanine nucleotide exchange factor for Rho/Rac/Cdc42-like GTPases|uniref:glycosyl hydrolase family 28-related protein n=5 Tax=Enterococcus faecalis TaxID=1351 RepID=UPI00059B01DB|nr:glycosyl hydrolase family 28-related protein [Enterococcus faecalis]EGO2636602.1 LPXTG cell wall anchor domain-containing protein [Enterococcus faecalis]EIB6530608.1 LPXTG cell wall anchor domain-containing protein [Enterococcus faecalis]MBE8842336.1 LPXTG cell wall anchor domain-containing protein [Enterococcus faecalis]MDN3099632.1 glycosyl hydrolase family 28-related protein [Enterococcus faecalis]MDN3102949.1 glycosyl hydrolase family 28-related protein [Enterococcus faecalis]